MHSMVNFFPDETVDFSSPESACADKLLSRASRTVDRCCHHYRHL